MPSLVAAKISCWRPRYPSCAESLPPFPDRARFFSAPFAIHHACVGFSRSCLTSWGVISGHHLPRPRSPWKYISMVTRTLPPSDLLARPRVRTG